MFINIYTYDFDVEGIHLAINRNPYIEYHLLKDFVTNIIYFTLLIFYYFDLFRNLIIEFILR